MGREYTRARRDPKRETDPAPATLRGMRRSAATTPLLTLAAVALLLAGCATGQSAARPGGVAADAPVIGAGTVIDDGAGPRLCLGPIGLSDPPSCAGVPLHGWDWDRVDGWSETGSTRWGSWAVPGTWDGSRLAVDGDPVPLALYDTTPFPWPEGTGPLTDADAARIGQELAGRWDGFLQGGPRDGRVDVVVVFDDGALQTEADVAYGEGAVVVTSALRPLTEG